MYFGYISVQMYSVVTNKLIKKYEQSVLNIYLFILRV